MDSPYQTRCNTRCNTLGRFIEEDDMDFHEAAESAVAKRKFLLNRLMKKKLAPDDDEEEDVAEGEV